MSKKRIAIIGAGITGLTLAYRLCKKGFNVSLFEKEPEVGGLGRGFRLGDWYLDRYYHHIFSHDRCVMSLIDELDDGVKIKWYDSTVGFFTGNRTYPLNTPFDILRFTPLSLMDRIRLGYTMLRFRREIDWRPYDNISIEEYYRGDISQKTYDVVWKPLLRSKFGDCYADISMAWLWGRLNPRVKSRSGFKEKLGYPDGGFQVLMNALKTAIERLGGEIQLKTRVDTLAVQGGAVYGLKAGGQELYFDRVVATCSIPQLDKLTCGLLFSVNPQLTEIQHNCVECLVLSLDDRISDYYWLNVCDGSMPFGGLIEHTNLIDRKHYGDRRLAYLFQYMPKDVLEKRRGLKSKDVAAEYGGYIREINPRFREDHIKESFVFRDCYATPIYQRGYANIRPKIETGITNLFFAGMESIYPQDRTLNNGVELAEKTAELLIKSLSGDVS